jgi:FkbH-like protein
VRFPTKDNAAIYDLILRLRDVFGKGVVLEEDSIRIQSIQRPRIESGLLSPAPSMEFFESLDAEVTFSSSKIPMDLRALELVNKTNQFNLNGKRYTDAEWRRFLTTPDSFLMTASYRDKFGPLGKVAVLAGSMEGRTLTIHAWVLSCRAFARRIEYRCLAELVTHFDPAQVVFDFAKTERNGPIQDFLTEILGEVPSPGSTAARENLPLLIAVKTQEAVYG